MGYFCIYHNDATGGGGLTQEEHDRLMALPTVEEIWAYQNMLSRIEFIFQVQAGRWEIVANQMIFYGEDNVTELARFDLIDRNGNPTPTNVMARSRV